MKRFSPNSRTTISSAAIFLSQQARPYFSPPPSADTHMRDAVDRGFHSAGAARLERLARVVQPHVAALGEEMSDMEIVVVHERDAPAEQRIECAFVDPLQMVLSDVVGRM